MEIRIMNRGNLQIDDARIVYRNFSGTPSKFNREGDRNFALVIDSAEHADMLREEGWNVKIKPPREDGDDPFMYLPVKIKFNNRGPNVYLRSGRAMNKLDEDSIGCLDDCDILSVDLDLRPYDWEVNGDTGRTAYLESMCVTQNVDRFANRYQDEDDSNL